MITYCLSFSKNNPQQMSFEEFTGLFKDYLNGGVELYKFRSSPEHNPFLYGDNQKEMAKQHVFDNLMSSLSFKDKDNSFLAVFDLTKTVGESAKSQDVASFLHSCRESSDKIKFEIFNELLVNFRDFFNSSQRKYLNEYISENAKSKIEFCAQHYFNAKTSLKNNLV